MEITIYILLFIFGIITYFLSMQDIKNIVHKMQYTLLSLLIWVSLAYNAFNIEYLYVLNSISNYSTKDYTLVGIALGFIVLCMLNVIVVGFYGSWEIIMAQIKTEK